MNFKRRNVFQEAEIIVEGPSLAILIEETQAFVGKRVLDCTGSTTKVDCRAIKGQRLLELASWGKHFLLCLESVVLRVHFLMYGSYRINHAKPGRSPQLTLKFRSGSIHLYSCSIRLLNEPIASIYDWRVDVMSHQWDEQRVRRLVAKQTDSMVCDVLLDQDVFAGAGNIIKNEVLFNLKLHPETKVGILTAAERRALVREARDYSLRFYRWKKAYVLRKNWSIYRKRTCPLCNCSVKMKKTGRRNRISFFCPTCQNPRKSSRAKKSRDSR
ncbi:MAG TPA: DNA-formamidopyrimidine glycosylase family protein [Pirellulales bacterium]